VTALPSLYVIDAAGMVRWSGAGLAPAQAIEEVLQSVLSAGESR
jgi:hypothetical protein